MEYGTPMAAVYCCVFSYVMCLARVAFAQANLANWDRTSAHLLFVEGSIGSGKTTLLRRLMQTVLPTTYPDVVTVGTTLTPLTSARTFGALGKVGGIGLSYFLSLFFFFLLAP